MSAEGDRKKDLMEKTREEIQDDLDNKRLGPPDSIKVAQAERRLSGLDRIEANAIAKKASSRSWAAIFDRIGRADMEKRRLAVVAMIVAIIGWFLFT